MNTQGCPEVGVRTRPGAHASEREAVDGMDEVVYDNEAIDEGVYEVELDSIFESPADGPCRSITALFSTRLGPRHAFEKEFRLRGRNSKQADSFAALFGMALASDADVHRLVNRAFYARMIIRLTHGTRGKRTVDVLCRL